MPTFLEARLVGRESIGVAWVMAVLAKVGVVAELVVVGLVVAGLITDVSAKVKLESVRVGLVLAWLIGVY